jgi:hypothetical protein
VVCIIKKKGTIDKKTYPTGNREFVVARYEHITIVKKGKPQKSNKQALKEKTPPNSRRRPVIAFDRR